MARPWQQDELNYFNDGEYFDINTSTASITLIIDNIKEYEKVVEYLTKIGLHVKKIMKLHMVQSINKN